MAQAPAIDSDLAVRLANEGVPLAAIARATRTPSSDLRLQLHEALDAGKLLALPREDWPVNCPRDQRPSQLARLGEHTDESAVAIGRLFGLTATELKLLLALLQSPLDKNRADMAGPTLDVHIHHIRKCLKSFGIEITTVWGLGYQIDAKHRRKAMDLIARSCCELSQDAASSPSPLSNKLPARGAYK